MQDDTRQTAPEEETIVKDTIKDSAFSDLFKIKKCLLQLYMEGNLLDREKVVVSIMMS